MPTNSLALATARTALEAKRAERKRKSCHWERRRLGERRRGKKPWRRRRREEGASSSLRGVEWVAAGLLGKRWFLMVKGIHHVVDYLASSGSSQLDKLETISRKVFYTFFKANLDSCIIYA